MRVLVACEYSGRVRDSFIRKGHVSFSCDILPSESPDGPHFQMDIKHVFDLGLSWDMLIAFPPCTHLAVSGARWFKEKQTQQKEAVDFFLFLVNQNIPKICIENPVGIMSTLWRKPDQYIHPWMFGHQETKKTCLWLKNLPLLRPTKIEEIRNKNLTPSGQNKLPPHEDRAKIRGLTYMGVALAMSDQWGQHER